VCLCGDAAVAILGPRISPFREKMRILQIVMFPIEPISTLEILVKGLFIGIIASAPMGPVGVLCLQRTLNKGRLYGLVTGFGAALSDIIYAIVTGFGMSFVMDFITNARNMFILQLVGSAMLLVFGIITFRSDPRRSFRPAPKKKGTLAHNFVTSFLLTLSNPLIIFLFIALFARFAFVIPSHPFEQGVGYVSIVGGAIAWWVVLTFFVDKVRTRFEVRGVRVLNRTIGGVVILASIAGFVFTLAGLHNPMLH
jgi:threonine/homoserine/homoserine lactone efflux protein